MASAPRSPALLLIAHGSSDPDWRRPIDQLVAHVRELAPDRPMRLCFLEKSPPDVQTAIDELVAEGAQSLRVVALLFSSTGKHFRVDIPHEIETATQRHPGLTVSLDPAAIGTHDRVLRAMAQAATDQ